MIKKTTGATAKMDPLLQILVRKLQLPTAYFPLIVTFLTSPPSCEGCAIYFTVSCRPERRVRHASLQPTHGVLAAPTDGRPLHLAATTPPRPLIVSKSPRQVPAFRHTFSASLPAGLRLQSRVPFGQGLRKAWRSCWPN